MRGFFWHHYGLSKTRQDMLLYFLLVDPCNYIHNFAHLDKTALSCNIDFVECEMLLDRLDDEWFKKYLSYRPQ